VAPDGHVGIAPDLAVEVVAPKDKSLEVEERLDDFLNAGTALVWLIYPETQSAYVVRADGSAARLTAEKELDGENVLPGFRYKLADLFQP
jgi:Uma2 family endonuclease